MSLLSGLPGRLALGAPGWSLLSRLTNAPFLQEERALNWKAWLRASRRQEGLSSRPGPGPGEGRVAERRVPGKGAREAQPLGCRVEVSW